MLTSEQTVEIYRAFDNWSDELFNMEPYWRRCGQCPNSGICCVESDPAVTPSEANLIRRFLAAMSLENQRIIRNRYFFKKRCVFKGFWKCLIHPVRPVGCRMYPYTALRQGKMIVYNSSLGNCIDMKINKARLGEIGKEGRFIRLPVGARLAYYCWDDAKWKIPNFSRLLKYSKENPLRTASWIAGNYFSL